MTPSTSASCCASDGLPQRQRPPQQSSGTSAAVAPSRTANCTGTHPSMGPSLFHCSVLLAVVAVALAVCTAPVQCTSGSEGGEWRPAAAWTEQERNNNLFSHQRAKRSPRRQLNSGAASIEGGELPWRKRYYVRRWDRLTAAVRSPSRRFVPIPPSTETEHKERLCGLKLTTRTKQLCGDCIPANMKQVILVDKKDDSSPASRDRLTEMCCVRRCSDEQIRNFCCRDSERF